MRRLAALAALAAILAGCGAPSADLFVVTRKGAGHNGNLTMLVADDGTVTCDGKDHTLSSQQLLVARALVRNLSPLAQLDLTIPPGRNHVLSYSVQMEAGTITFTDTSHPLPKTFAQMTAFTTEVSEGVCHLVHD